MFDGTTGIVAALAALIILIERISARVTEYRATRNGSRPFCKADADALEARIRKYHDENAVALKQHVAQNAHEHRELHDKIDRVRDDVSYIRGKLDRGE